jgi:hypothetical protein
MIASPLVERWRLRQGNSHARVFFAHRHPHKRLFYSHFLKVFFSFILLISTTSRGETEKELLARKNANCHKLLIQFLEANKDRLASLSDNLLLKLFGPQVLIPEKKIKTLKIVNLQTQNLYLTRGKWEFEWNEALGRRVRIQKTDPLDKNPAHTAAQAEFILKKNADIVILNEVEGISSALKFNQDFLKSQYIPIAVPGNDPRELMTVLLVKAGLPVKISFESHATRTHTVDLLGTTFEQPVFTRDLVFLLLSRLDSSETDKPSLIIGATHLKSQRPLPSDPGAFQHRTAEIDLTIQIFNEYKERFGSDVPYALIGDFNASLWKDPSLKRLLDSLQLKDALRILNPNAKESDLITHVYFPTEFQRVTQQMDGILVSPHLVPHISDGSVYRWPDENGIPKDIPDSMVERNQNPSDHFPIFTEINVEHLF